MKKLPCFLGFHKWELKKQRTVMFTNINIYKCEHCQEEKEMWETCGKEVKQFKLK